MKMSRLLSIILCLCMFVSLFSMSAMADNEPPVFVPEGFDSGEGEGEGEGVGDTDGDGNQPPLEPTDSTDPPLVPEDGENTGDTDDGNVDPNTPAPVADPLLCSHSLLPWRWLLPQASLIPASSFAPMSAFIPTAAWPLPLQLPSIP